MISADSIKHQPLPARIRFIRPSDSDKRGVDIYTDTELAMVLQRVDNVDGIMSFRYLPLQEGTPVKIEGENYVVKRVDVLLYNLDILMNHNEYPLVFDTLNVNSGFVLSIEVLVENPS